MEMELNVVLPQPKQSVSRPEKLKTIWLLHGGSGDTTAWLRMSCAERYAVEHGVALVVPGVHQSCFSDMAHGGRYFTYMTEELYPIVQHMFDRFSRA